MYTYILTYKYLRIYAYIHTYINTYKHAYVYFINIFYNPTNTLGRFTTLRKCAHRQHVHVP